MLPVAYQIPAAVILIAGGLLACFAGYRLFRVVLGVYGFILGALVASSIMGPNDTLPMIVAALVGGLIGAVILNLAYFVGVALIGAGAAALLLNMVWSQIGHGDPHIAVVIIAAVIGAILAVQLQRLVIIVATAFGGSWTVLVGALALMGDASARAAAASSSVWIAYPLSAGQRPAWVVIAWLVLGFVGMAAQLQGKSASTKTAKKRK